MSALMRATGDTIRRLESELVGAAFAPCAVPPGAGQAGGLPRQVDAELWRTDLRRHLVQLTQSLSFDNLEMFADYLIWSRAASTTG